MLDLQRGFSLDLYTSGFGDIFDFLERLQHKEDSRSGKVNVLGQ